MTVTFGPIFKLLRKDQGCVWAEDCHKAFDSIKEYLLETPILIPPMQGIHLVMYLTILEDSMGCVLSQQCETGRKEDAIYYSGKKFTDYESRYSMLENTYVLAWMLLSEYDIEYHTKKGIKGSILDDHLAHQPMDDYQSIQFDFPTDVMYLKAKDYDEPSPSEGPYPESRRGLIFDGDVNAFGNGIGAFIVTPQGYHMPFTTRLTFTCTNNVEEYEACMMGLEEAIDLRIKNYGCIWRFSFGD
ncbi:uncharacterized protein LOC127122427 [Lathyrus oleraceus]|uniref:uncharacterized protein LOC127122427 n=1 Tax=Pisum sativum TaxID=3888 RepID=UPI0021D190C8|nr:uncharacterized protein LOC127122427 [Pisum sativum]